MSKPRSKLSVTIGADQLAQLEHWKLKLFMPMPSLVRQGIDLILALLAMRFGVLTPEQRSLLQGWGVPVIELPAR